MPATQTGAFYHCYSRIVDRQFLLDDPLEKQCFLSLVREYEAFCGVNVLTHCIMGNHFHLLIEVPQQPDTPLSTQEVLDRVSALSGTATPVARLQLQIDQCRAAGDTAGEQAIVGRVAGRMGDLSWFMKLLKGRFTQGYNRRHGRRGTLWEERFGSVLVEGGEGLAAVGAYLELNSVRAGVAADPKDYRWSGYGEAMGGGERALAGLRRLAAVVTGKALGDGETLAWYRMEVYGRGEEREGTDAQGQALRRGLSAEAVRAVLAAKGRLPVSEYVRCRVRYFSAGVVLGSAGFVDGVFRKFRERFGRKRERGARRMRGVEEKLYVLRDLRLRVFG